MKSDQAICTSPDGYDEAGNVVWTKTYGDSINRFIFRPISFTYFYPIKIKQTRDGGFIIITVIDITPNSFTDLVLLKTDSLGNVQWEKRHGRNSQYEIGMDIIETPDSGYFAVGCFYTGVPTQQGYYLLKTNSLGSMGCDEFTDSIAQAIINPTDSDIVILDSVLTINRYVANVQDSSDLPPYSLISCSVGISEINGDEDKLNVYPNPSTGVFHFFFKTEDVIEETKVFNYLGEQIFYREGKTTEINLSNAASGLYFYSLKAKDGKTFSGKMMKQ